MSLSIQLIGADLLGDILPVNITPFESGTHYFAAGTSTKLDGKGGIYLWDPTSTATGDGYNVLKQNHLGPSDPGRWIRLGYNADWTESDSTKKAYIANKPSLVTGAISGSYSDLSGTATLA